MAINGINAALSGLIAASTRLAGSAANIANLQSRGKALDQPVVPDPNAPPDPGYQPVKTVQTSIVDAGGGTRATYSPVRPASVPIFDPGAIDANDQGLAARPNVQLEGEITDQILSARSFQANLKTVRASDEITKSLLDIKT
jgi:flagellar basal-body rod protein FlgC